MTKKGLLSLMLASVCIFSSISASYATTIDFEEEETAVVQEQTTATTSAPITKKTNTTKSEALIPDSDIVDTDEIEENVKNLSGLMGGVTVDEEVVADVNKKMEPVAHIVKYVIGFGLAIVSLGMLVYTVSDFLYINIPILRNTLVDAKLISDEAKMVVTPDEAATARRGGMSGMGGYMGGFSGGYEPEYSGAGREGGKKETPNTQYFKLRSKTMVMFAICSVLCLSTLFTQLGLWLGTSVLKIFTFFF